MPPFFSKTNAISFDISTNNHDSFGYNVCYFIAKDALVFSHAIILLFYRNTLYFV